MGRWAPLLRTVAGHDWDKLQRVLRWPMHEVLEAYLEDMRRTARHKFEIELMVWAIQLPHIPKGKNRKAPKPPAILT